MGEQAPVFPHPAAALLSAESTTAVLRGGSRPHTGAHDFRLSRGSAAGATRTAKETLAHTWQTEAEREQ